LVNAVFLFVKNAGAKFGAVLANENLANPAGGKLSVGVGGFSAKGAKVVVGIAEQAHLRASMTWSMMPYSSASLAGM
jgi:hypothetical protein